MGRTGTLSLKWKPWSAEVVISFILALALTAFVSVLACNDIDGMVGDTALYAEMTESILKTGQPESVVHASMQDFVDRGIAGIPVDERLAQPEWITGPEETSRNILTFHFYLILYVLAPFTLLASGVTVLTVAQVASSIMALWLLYILFREKGVPRLVLLAGLALLVFHPSFGSSLYGAFYPDRLFVFFGIYLIYTVTRSRFFPIQFGIAYALCLLTGERAALYAGAFLLAWTVFHWNEEKPRRVLFLATGVAALAYYAVLTKFVLSNLYYTDLSLSGLLSNFSIPGYGFLVLKFLLINVVLFGIIAIFDWRAAIIGFCSMIPNLMYSVGGAEKLGWSWHYHCFYLTILMWAAFSGVCGLYQRLSEKKSKRLALSAVLPLVLLQCTLLSVFEPYSTTSLSFGRANVQNSFPAITLRKTVSYSGVADVSRALSAFLQEQIPPGSSVSSVDLAMPYVYSYAKISVYPMDLASADYIISGYLVDETGAVCLIGAATYYGSEETARYNAEIQRQLADFGYDLTQMECFAPYQVAVIPRSK